MKFTVAPQADAVATDALFDELDRRQAVSHELAIAKAVEHAFDHDDTGCEVCDDKSQFLTFLRSDA